MYTVCKSRVEISNTLMEMCLSLMKIILVQSPDFKDDLDTDYIWVFISCYVNKDTGGP